MKPRPPRLSSPRLLTLAGALLVSGLLAGTSFAGEPPTAGPKETTAVARPLAFRGSLLIVGNSFQYGDGSPVQFFRPHTVTDLNGTGGGGVAALFKAFANQAGLDYAVSLETISGSALDQHIATKKNLIDRRWDHVVMAGHSLLDQKNPGNPALLVRTAREMAELLHQKNSKVEIRLIATWSRADHTYNAGGHWHGKPIAAMARDIRAGCDLAAAGTPLIRGVIPVGEAWLRAMNTGVADPNPYDGTAFGQIDLWTHDHIHGSSYGYYLEALTIFGAVTGLDPRALGPQERASIELGFSRAQATALQNVASDELAAAPGARPLQAFTPIPLPR